MNVVMARVSSSNVDTWGYDKENHMLAIQFKGGGVYLYYGVPPEIAAAFQASPSKGIYFNGNIKGRYGFTKLQLEPVPLRTDKNLFKEEMEVKVPDGQATS
jgi:hypothetical protein